MLDLQIDSDAKVVKERHVTRRDLHNYINAGEGAQIEFKRHFTSPEKIAKEMIALANSKGGVIIFGVGDDRKVVGIESEKSELEEIEHTSEFLCEPPIPVRSDIIRYDGVDVVVVTVPESKEKPHTLIEYDTSGKRVRNAKATGFVRVGEKSVQASDEVMNVMRSRHPDAPPLRIAIGHNEKMLFDYLHKFEKIDTSEFADLVNISRRRASKILVDLVRSGTLLLHTGNMKEYYTLAE
jgi:predicted HTH transcriptional regulator